MILCERVVSHHVEHFTRANRWLEKVPSSALVSQQAIELPASDPRWPTRYRGGVRLAMRVALAVFSNDHILVSPYAWASNSAIALPLTDALSLCR